MDIYNSMFYIGANNDSCSFINSRPETYLISDKEKLNRIKITVLPYKEDTYYIYWHDEGKGQFCCKCFFDECFDIIQELPKENIVMRF